MTTPESCRECRARHRDTNAKTRTGHDRSKLLQHGISLFLIRVGDVVVEHGLGICCCDGDVINDVAAQSGWARWNRSFELLGKFTFAFFLIVIVVTPVTVGVEEVANGARRTHSTVLMNTRLGSSIHRIIIFRFTGRNMIERKDEVLCFISPLLRERSELARAGTWW